MANTHEQVLETIRKGQARTLYKGDVQAVIDHRIEHSMEASGWTQDRATVEANFFKNSPDGAALYEALTVAKLDPEPEYQPPMPDSFDTGIGNVAEVVAKATGTTKEQATAELLKANPALYDEYLAEHQPTVESVRKMEGVVSADREPVAKISRDELRKRAKAEARAIARRIMAGEL